MKHKRNDILTGWYGLIKEKWNLICQDQNVYHLKQFLVTSNYVCQCTQNWFRLFYYKQWLYICSWKVFIKIHPNTKDDINRSKSNVFQEIFLPWFDFIFHDSLNLDIFFVLLKRKRKKWMLEQQNWYFLHIVCFLSMFKKLLKWLEK